MRSGLASRGVDYIAYLEALVAYLKADTTEADIHPRLVPDLKKRFSRLDKPGMIAQLERYGFAYDPDGTKASLIGTFNKELPKYMKLLSSN